MRRADKEIRDRDLISQIIEKCQVCRLGLAQDNMPYIVPVSFGYDGEAIYFHTAKTGRKIGFIEANATACFELEHGVSLRPHEDDPCSWSFSFQSVIGYGTIRELTDAAEREAGLRLIMRHYSGRDWSFTLKSLETIRIWKLTIDSISGKQSRDYFTP
jgi:uncharacterized protein